MEVYDQKNAPSRARRVLRTGDTIIGTVRPGNRSFAYIHQPGLTASTGFATMRPKTPHYQEFVYWSLKRDEAIDQFAHLADGGAYPAIRPEVVAGFQSIMPNDNILMEFSDLVAPMMRQIGQNTLESRTLASTRDSLLPSLISGEISAVTK